ncbi:hypothetical protein [Sphingomonas koreensis]|nr:hypothetical protein [Sphingomonas koreensis]
MIEDDVAAVLDDEPAIGAALLAAQVRADANMACPSSEHSAQLAA